MSGTLVTCQQKNYFIGWCLYYMYTEYNHEKSIKKIVSNYIKVSVVNCIKILVCK